MYIYLYVVVAEVEQQVQVLTRFQQCTGDIATSRGTTILLYLPDAASQQ